MQDNDPIHSKRPLHLGSERHYISSRPETREPNRLSLIRELALILDLVPPLLHRRTPQLSQPVFVCTLAHVSHRLHDSALAPAGGLARVLTLLDLANHQLKRLLHVLVVARAGLGPAAAQLRRQRLALLGGDLALLRTQIRLVADDDKRDVFGGLCDNVLAASDRAGGTGLYCWMRGGGVGVDVTDQVVEDLVAYYAGHLERLLVGDRVDDHVAVDADEVLRVEDAWTVQPMCMGDYGVQTRGDARAAYLAGGIDDLGGIFLVLVADDLAERVLDGGCRAGWVDQLTDGSAADNGNLALLRAGHGGGGGGWGCESRGCSAARQYEEAGQRRRRAARARRCSAQAVSEGRPLGAVGSREAYTGSNYRTKKQAQLRAKEGYPGGSSSGVYTQRAAPTTFTLFLAPVPLASCLFDTHTPRCALGCQRIASRRAASEQKQTKAGCGCAVKRAIGRILRPSPESACEATRCMEQWKRARSLAQMAAAGMVSSTQRATLQSAHPLSRLVSTEHSMLYKVRARRPSPRPATSPPAVPDATRCMEAVEARQKHCPNIPPRVRKFGLQPAAFAGANPPIASPARVLRQSERRKLPLYPTHYT
ncbi:hypothetical protein PSPO01_03705 [Paraphaeosphaeria sporulosa]